MAGTSVLTKMAGVAAPRGRDGLRLDIQGLRAVAVSIVVLYHAEVGAVSGGFVGVDVFFVISGYLITGGLVRELEERGDVSLRDFYARRARRILPAATVLLIVVSLTTLLLLPTTRRDSIGWDVIASALYFQNWRLDAASTDYLAANDAASPLQHFWSLAVEEQFYLLWPLLLLAVAMLLRGLASRSRSHQQDVRARWLQPLLLVGVATVVLPSLAVSILMTSKDPAGAYFVTQTRLWELGVGALLAIASPFLDRVPRPLAWLLGWVGLAGIVWATFAFTDTTPFPGYHALVPTLGAALIIAAGAVSKGRASAGRLLGLRPLRLLGNLSYSYYLWHWPFVVFVLAQVGPEDFDYRWGLLAVGLALVPSWLSYTYVERPFLSRRDDSSSSTLQSGLIAMLVTVMAGNTLIWTVWPAAPVSNGLTISVPERDENDEVIKVGAMVLDREPRDDQAGRPLDVVASIFPRPGSSGIAGCPTLADDTDVTPCTYGDRDAATSVVLLGDSHAAQWASGLIGAAAKSSWSVSEFTKQSCPSAGIPVVNSLGEVNDACTEWLYLVIPEIIDMAPDVVVVSGVDRVTTDANGDPLEGAEDNDSAQAAGYVRVWERFEDAGIDVIALQDTPRPGFDVPECVSQNLDSLTKCTFDRDAGTSGGNSLELASEQSGVPLVDLNDAICPTSRCAPVIGNYLVYNDDNHMTSTYASTMVSRIRRSFTDAAEVLGGRSSDGSRAD